MNEWQVYGGRHELPYGSRRQGADGQGGYLAKALEVEGFKFFWLDSGSTGNHRKTGHSEPVRNFVCEA
jgi:hypothetical protein